uniref:Secreted protein n=1 Tax=Ixodes ricinus TaxID=34613 RepID=A0A6B0V366_IXORI
MPNKLFLFFVQCLISLAGLRGSLMLQLESTECSASKTMMRQLDSTERLDSETPTAQSNHTDHQHASSRLWSQSHGSSEAPSHVNKEPGNMFKPLVLSDIADPGATSTTRPAPTYETTKGPRWLLSVRGHGGTSQGAMVNPLMFFMQVSNDRSLYCKRTSNICLLCCHALGRVCCCCRSALMSLLTYCHAGTLNRIRDLMRGALIPHLR